MRSSLARLVVRASAWLVPASLRARWREEWLGEIASQKAEGTRQKRQLLRAALGAPRDALSIRWLSLRAGLRHSAGGLRNDVRQTVRLIARSPGHVAMVIVSLLIGLVPTIVAVSTVNGGALSVDGARGRVRAANVNGALDLTGLGGGEVSAKTVNGGVAVQFDRAPASDSTFATVNGKVTIELPRDARAEVSVETLHGDLYTDFEVEAVPVKAVAERDSGSGHRYRFRSETVVRIGESGAGGAVRLECKTVNGDVVVRAR